MGKHRDRHTRNFVDFLREKGKSLGFIAETEYPLILRTYFADVVWKIHPNHPPLVTFEVETKDTSSLFKNTMKYFGTSSKVVAKPLYHYIIVLKGRVSEGNKAALHNVIEEHNVALFEDLLGNPYEMARFQRELESYWTYTGIKVDDLQKLLEFSHDKKTQRIALNRLIRQMFPGESGRTREIVDNLTDLVFYHSSLGFYHENLRQAIHLKQIQTNSQLDTEDNYFEVVLKAEYDVINISGRKLPYLVRFQADNFVFKDMPLTKNIDVKALVVETIRMTDGKVIKGYDLLSRIREKYPQMLRPIIVADSIAVVNLNYSPNLAESHGLEKMRTVSVNPRDKLRISMEWTVNTRRQDSYQNTLSYFTRGFEVEVEVPRNVSVAFTPNAKGEVVGTRQTYARSDVDLVRYIWKISGLVSPGEGIVVSWSS